jgi:hypothetical protein
MKRALLVLLLFAGFAPGWSVRAEPVPLTGTRSPRSAPPTEPPAVGPATSPGGGAPGRIIRLFKLSHREPAEAFAVVEPLLSPNGTVTVTGRLRMLTVQDDEEHVRLIGDALAQFDVPPRSYRVQVTFYRASGSNDDPSRIPSAPAQLRGLGRRLADLLRYSQYDRIDEIVVTGEEGVTLSSRMGGEYSVDFAIDGDPGGRGELRLRNFKVSRIRRDERGNEQLSHVFATTVNLKLEKPFVLGATRDEKSRSALVIVLLAHPVEEGR